MRNLKREKRMTGRAASVIAALFCLILIIFTGCSRSAGSSLAISPAKLTQKEEDILKLYGGDANSRIFDFRTSSDLKAASVRLKILNASGQWMDHGRAVLGSDDNDGRILVTSVDGWETVKMVVQDSSGTESVSFQPGEDRLPKRMIVSSWLEEDTEIVSGKEIPLLIHVESDSNEVRSYGMSAFDDPSALAGYNQVFAVTVTFSEP